MISRFVPIADPHCGLKIGLMPPKVIQDEGTKWETTYRQGKTQRKVIWPQWKKAKAQVFDGTADEVIIALMGDLVHGDKRPAMCFSASMKLQADTAIQALLDFTGPADKTYAIAGTEWHVGPDGFVENYIAKELGAYKHYSFQKMDVTIQGVRFGLQHKGPSLGSRSWIEGNGMRATLRDAHIKAMQEGRQTADYYLWAHWHTRHHEPLEVKTPKGVRMIHGYTLPGLCTADEYALANVKNLEYSDIGMIYFDIEDGRVTERKAYIRFDNVERVKHGQG